LFEFYTDGFADASADARVDLVKDDGAWKLGSIGHGLEHEHQTRRLAAGGDAREWLHVFAHVGGEIELHVIYSGLPKLFHIRVHLHLKPGVLLRHFSDTLLDSSFQQLSNFHSLLMNLLSAVEILLFGNL